MIEIKEYSKAHCLYRALWFYAGAMTLVVLGRILFDQGAGYDPDPGAFFRMTSDLADAFLGRQSWLETLKSMDERTATMFVPPALLAALTGFRSPEFYMTVAWAIYVLPLPFLYLSLVRSFRELEPLDFTVAALFLATPFLTNLGALYFTDVPSLTFAVAGLVCLAHGLNKSTMGLMAVGFFLLALAVSVRLANAVPFSAALAFLAWMKWPFLHACRRQLGQAILLAILAVLIFGTIFRLDIPIIYALKLNASWDQTIWKYGNTNAELGIENLFVFRFWNFIRVTLVIFYPFIALLAASLAWGRNKTVGHRTRHAALALLAAVLYCVFAAKTMHVNDRYVIPVLALFLPALAATRFDKIVVRTSASMVLLFCAFTLHYQLRTDMDDRTLPGNLSAKLFRLSTPISIFSGRVTHSPLSALTNVLLAASEEKRSVSIEFLSPLSPPLQEKTFRSYLEYMGASDALSAMARKKIGIRGYHTHEMKAPEIYNRFVGQNARAYFNADYIILAMDNLEHEAEYRSFFPAESGVAGNIRNLAQQHQEHTVGLTPVAPFLGMGDYPVWSIPSYLSRQYNFYRQIRYQLYKVDDPVRFEPLLHEHFCKLKGINAPEFRLWCGQLKFSGVLKEVTVAQQTMASSGLIQLSDAGPMLKLDLKWPPKSGFCRVYVHFLPQPQATADCPFFTADHDAWRKDSKEDYASFPAERLQALNSCRYVVNVGVQAENPGKAIFLFDEFRVKGSVQ